MFTKGFDKVAKDSKEEHDKSKAVTDALIGRLPFGTTIHTMAGDRPHGHSRAKEWASRVGGSLIGGLAGGALGHALHRRGGGTVGGVVGGGIGEYLASKHVRKGTKEKY